MSKINLPKTILISTFFIAFTLISGLFIYGYLEIKKAGDLPVDFIETVKPENNNNQEPESVEPTEPVELETYEAELFIEAKWGDGEGEVGIYRSAGDEGGAGPAYGPQSFDVDDRTGYLYLLDSVNQRIIEYDESGKCLRDFPIACGGTGDVKISPDYKYFYVWSNRCGRIYKHDRKGEFLESYKVIPGKNPGIGGKGIDFDENGNVMLDLRIKEYNDWSRFYQIGKNGDEWKENYYKGYISRDGKELYYSKFLDDHTVGMFSESKDKGVVEKLFEVKLPISDFRNGCHFIGSDKKNNIYIESLLGPFISEMYFEKYTKNGKLLVKVDILEPLRKIYNVTDNKDIPKYFYTYPPLISIRVSYEGNVYYMFTFENEGTRIFKYSKIK